MDIDSVDVSDDVSFVEGEDLSEEFQTKATIFELLLSRNSVVKSKDLKWKTLKQLRKKSDAFKKELTEKVDLYLDYVVKEWMQENELAIDRGLKGEIAEDLLQD